MISNRAHWIHDTDNWGDIFTPFLFEKAFGIHMELASREDANVFACGSLLERVADGFTGHILGSGMGYAETRRDLMNVKAPLLLRGQLTADRCTYQLRSRLGDPGLLAFIFAPKVVPTVPVGVIPHYVDKKNEELSRLVNYGEVTAIDIQGGIQEVIEAVASCQRIVSSSLHGLVLADSLGIPSKWMQLSGRIYGEGFKFHDYYSAYGETEKPSSSIQDAMADCHGRNVDKIKKDVLDVFLEYVEWLRYETSIDLRRRAQHSAHDGSA